MVSFLRKGLVVFVLGLCFIPGRVDAQEKRSREFVLSLLHPTEMSHAEDEFDSAIERLLSKPLWDVQIPVAKFPFTDGYAQRQKRTKEVFPALFPGKSLEMASQRWVKIASLNPIPPVPGRRVAFILDSAPDPTTVYSSFEIEVDHSKYMLKLYGINDGKDKSLLFTCRTGLGSPDYPTPKGSYYIVRIFDDRPLWIPPPRDWAYGDSPSRSVYGGHMMPFYVKKPVVDKSEETIMELDDVAPAIKMVDTETYRVHGTDSPWSVGSNQSHGCVRLKNPDVKRLADTLKMYVGTTIRGETPNGKYIDLARPVKLRLF
jgi:lipoprotein-anchoring transpeptidase ErfK/SrfK